MERRPLNIDIANDCYAARIRALSHRANLLAQNRFGSGERGGDLDFEQNLHNVFAPHALDIGRGRTAHAPTEFAAQRLAQSPHRGREPLGVGTPNYDANQSRIGRIREHLALGKQSRRHVFVVARGYLPEERVRRLGGLHDDLARAVASPATPRNLHNQLPRPLDGAEIGRIQQVVGIEYPDERNAVEVKTFGDYLRTDQNIRLVAGKGGDYAICRTLGGGRFAIHTQHPCRREDAGNLLLDALRTEAHRHDIGTPAGGTARR